MFSFDLSDKLKKKVNKLAKKDKILAIIFKRKLLEVINHNLKTIDTYKNLRSPKHEYKRIHLTDNYILIFHVNKKENHIIFLDIIHRDNAYN